jgi:PilZ domain
LCERAAFCGGQKNAHAAETFVKPVAKALLKADRLSFDQIAYICEQLTMSEVTIKPRRRQSERTPVKVQVFVHCRGRFQRAKITDFSQSGLQLDGTFGLINTDVVQVELVSGVRMLGKVEWSLGGQTGVTFSQPLAASHPAMVELARKAT